ncbi:MAG: protein kinase [Vicinamibacterales bacterium]
MPAWQRVREVFDEVVSLPPEDRAARLERLCGGDHALRDEVQSLLSHDGPADPVASIVGRAAREVIEAGPELHPGDTLLHYVIGPQVGEGGMGVVWRATDRSLGRDVALKVLPPAVARDPARLARLEREARVLATLNHSNIATVYSVHDAGGHRFLAMEYVDGEDLATRLGRGPLPLAAAVRFARQVADGLEEAHAKGIVHRDLKPANIKITPSGKAKVLDFGLAKVFEGDTPPPAAQDERRPSALESHEGLVLGTAAYMAPEQATGQAVDERADIWAFGVVVFEMIAGRRPFAGPTVTGALTSAAGADPDWTLLPAETPAQLVQLIRRCLVKDAGDRLSDIGEARRELEMVERTLESGGRQPSSGAAAAAAPTRRWWPAVAAAAVVALAASAALPIWRGSSSATDAPPRRILAVLPFDNLGAPDDDYFADGVTDEVRGKLVALPELQVIARASSNQYRATDKSLKQIGRELGATYLLTATVRWDREEGRSRVRVSPELVDAATGATRWQQPFDAVLSDVFDVQARIAAEVAAALGVALEQGDRARLDTRPTSNVSAYEAYLKGNAATGGVVSQAPVDLQMAVTAYGRAVALDPAFALAWAHLSHAHSQLYAFGVPAPRDREQALRAAQRALALSPNLPAAHLALGRYYDLILKDWPRALEQYALGLQAAPGDVDLMSVSAQVQQRAGLWDASLASLRRARQLDPRSVAAARDLTRILLRLRRYDEAAAVADEGLSVAPTSLDLIEFKAMASLGRGDLDGARAVIANATRTMDPASVVAYVATYWDLAWVLDDEQRALLLRLGPEAFGRDAMSWGIALADASALGGDRAGVATYAEAARAAAAEQLEGAPEDGQRHVFLGLALAYLGRRAEAVREGERALALLPPERDASAGAYLLHQLARIYVRVGRHDQAIDILERLLAMPYYVSPGWLRIDPEFAPLAGNARFVRLLGGT